MYRWGRISEQPLLHPTVQGNPALVDELLGAGVDGSAGWEGCEGPNLFFAAALSGNKGAVLSLLRAGALPDENVLSAAPYGRSPLCQAVSSGHQAGARLGFG